jgi:hypothetical protein
MSGNIALKKAEDDTLAEILTWVQEVVEGRGNSIAQMVISVVLGCLPFVGQAVDAYNILRSLYALTRAPSSSESWIQLSLALVAVVPGIGDALKNAFMMMRSGKKMGRILDSMPNSLRGNVEAWFRKLDWPEYTTEMKQAVSKILSGIVDVLDNRISGFLLGQQGVQQLVARLKELNMQAVAKIDEAMDVLRAAHRRALQDPLPSTAATGRVSTTAARTPTPGTQAPGSVRSTSSGTTTPAVGTANGTKRQSERSTLNRPGIGVSGEHIADYYFVRRQRSRSKVSFNGNLFEMRQPGHQGIDHVWHSTQLPHGYRISDTKGTGGPFHRLESARAAFEALEYGIDAYLGEEDEGRARGAMNSRETRAGKQMSHRWIADKIETAQLLPGSAAELLPEIEAWEDNDFKLGVSQTISDGQMNRTLVRCPYDRSIITVVGPNHNDHERAAGGTSGRCAKPVASHRIATEFVLPNTILLK